MQRGRGGVEYEDAVAGDGPRVERGSVVTIRYDLFLHQGERVQTDMLVTFELGHRRVIAGLEYGVEGMRAGGQRRLRVSPHLGYGEQGLPGVIPPNALLDFRVTLLEASEPGANADESAQ